MIILAVNGQDHRIDAEPETPGSAGECGAPPAKDPTRRYARLLSIEKADGTELAIPNEEDERGRDNAVAAESLEGVWLPIQTFPQFFAKLMPLANENARSARAQQTGLPPNTLSIWWSDSG